MKITSVNLKKIFPGQIQFTNTTVGMEASVDEGEDPSDVLDKLKDKIESWHMANQIAEEARRVENAKEVTPWVHSKVTYNPMIDMPHPEEKTIQVSENQDPILRGINEAQSLEELAKYKTAAGNSGFMILYMNKVKELTNAIK
jgi:hypothetical protein